MRNSTIVNNIHLGRVIIGRKQSTMKWNLTSEPIGELINDYVYDGYIDIPEHQRPFIWNIKKQTSLINTVASNMPIPNVIFSETHVNGKRKRWIEDGQQRFLSLKKFICVEDNNGGIIKFNGKSFDELDIRMQEKIKNYPIGITQYWDSTQEERELLFDLYQNGVPLSTGQRYWHWKRTSPLVKFAIDALLSPSSSIYASITFKLWGTKDLNADTSTKLNLNKAVSFVCGAAFGVNHITKSFTTIGPMLSNEFDIDIANDRLAYTLKTLQEMSTKCKFTAAQRKRFWDAGTLAGYILYAYMADIDIDWVQFAQKSCDFEKMMKNLHSNKLSSRAWDLPRWKQGILNVQNILNNINLPVDSSHYDSSEEEEGE